MLRDPGARLLSHYRYWLATQPSNPLHRYVVATKPTFAQFVRLPALRNLYTRVFLHGHDLDDLDLVGTVEQLDTTVQLLGELLGRPVRMERVNVTAGSGEGANEIHDPEIVQLIRTFHREDLELFHEASRRLSTA